MANFSAETAYRFATLTPDEVYSAWIDPEKVQRWMSHQLASQPGEGTVTGVEIDARPGGRYRFSGLQDGEQSDSWGYYRELIPGRRLVFTWFVEPGEEEEDNSTVTLELESEGSGCRARMAHEMDEQWAEYSEQTAAAWHSMSKAIDETFG